MLRQLLVVFSMLATSTLAAAPVKASVVSIVDVVRVIDGDTVEIKSDGRLVVCGSKGWMLLKQTNPGEPRQSKNSKF